MFHVSEIIWQLLCEGEKWLWLEPAATSKIWCHHCHRVCVTGEVLSWVIWSYFIALLWHCSWLVISWDSHSTVQCLDNLQKSVLSLPPFSIAKHFKPVLVSINLGAINRMLILYYIYCGSWCPIFTLWRNIMTHILSAEPGMRALSSFPTVNDPVKCLYCSTVKFLHEVEYTSLQQTILLLLLLHTSNHHFRCSLTVSWQSEQSVVMFQFWVVIWIFYLLYQIRVRVAGQGGG